MSFDQGPISDRTLVVRLGAGVTGAAFVAGVPVEGNAASGGTAAPFTDPTAKYPMPLTPDSRSPGQDWASEMNLRPEHGENSYRGSGRLNGRKALITGGDSGMGRQQL